MVQGYGSGLGFRVRVSALTSMLSMSCASIHGFSLGAITTMMPPEEDSFACEIQLGLGLGLGLGLEGVISDFL